MKMVKVKNVSKTTIGVPNGSGGTIMLAPEEEASIPEKYLPQLAGQVVRATKRSANRSANREEAQNQKETQNQAETETSK